jgi:effector-binding domain-containing protein
MSEESEAGMSEQSEAGMSEESEAGMSEESEAGMGVELVTVEARRTVVVRATTTWEAFPSVWGGLLDEVYAVVRKPDAGVADPDGPGWRNVMLYRDDRPTVEVGVLVGGTFAGAGRVEGSTLPGGEVARTVHRGSYAELDVAHRRVVAWCRASGRRRAGPRWEIYGHWREDPAEVETEIYYLLE